MGMFVDLKEGYQVRGFHTRNRERLYGDIETLQIIE